MEGLMTIKLLKEILLKESLVMCGFGGRLPDSDPEKLILKIVGATLHNIANKLQKYEKGGP